MNDVEKTTETIEIEVASTDTEHCPDCSVELNQWAAGGMQEQSECPECGERFTVEPCISYAGSRTADTYW